MDTLTDSLSFNAQFPAVYKQNTVVPYSNFASLLTASKVAFDKGYSLVAEPSGSVFDEFEVNPLVLADRNTALQTIQEILSTAQLLKLQIQQSPWLSGPACPYEKTLIEYLGPSYIVPTINDLAFPKEFSVEKSVKSIVNISKHFDDKLMSHVQIMSAEAADTSFAGITSENLGHAFAVTSATANGQELVVDREKTAKHLEFVELIRHIPTEYILQNPLIVAQKLVSRFIEIHQS